VDAAYSGSPGQLVFWQRQAVAIPRRRRCGRSGGRPGASQERRPILGAQEVALRQRRPFVRRSDSAPISTMRSEKPFSRNASAAFAPARPAPTMTYAVVLVMIIPWWQVHDANVPARTDSTTGPRPPLPPASRSRAGRCRRTPDREQVDDDAGQPPSNKPATEPRDQRHRDPRQHLHHTHRVHRLQRGAGHQPVPVSRDWPASTPNSSAE